MSEGIWERDDYEQQQDGIINPEDQLSEDGMDQVLEQGYSPPERPLALDKFGTTLAEERQGETLDQRLAEEEPDPNMEVDLVEGEPPLRAGEEGDVPDDVDLGEAEIPDDVVDYGIVDDGEVGDARAGRLVDPDAGGTGDTEKDLIGYDVGVDGAAAFPGPAQDVPRVGRSVSSRSMAASASERSTTCIAASSALAAPPSTPTS